jgi:hypothetical protein
MSLRCVVALDVQEDSLEELRWRAGLYARWIEDVCQRPERAEWSPMEELLREALQSLEHEITLRERRKAQAIAKLRDGPELSRGEIHAQQVGVRVA